METVSCVQRHSGGLASPGLISPRRRGSRLGRQAQAAGSRVPPGSGQAGWTRTSEESTSSVQTVLRVTQENIPALATERNGSRRPAFLFLRSQRSRSGGRGSQLAPLQALTFHNQSEPLTGTQHPTGRSGAVRTWALLRGPQPRCQKL